MATTSATTALRIEMACRPARIGDATAHRGTSGASMVGSSATWSPGIELEALELIDVVSGCPQYPQPLPVAGTGQPPAER